MEERIEELLNGPGYFVCERLHARMPILTCIKLQTENKTIKRWGGKSLNCIKCKQGEQIMAEQERGKGEEEIQGQKICKICGISKDHEKDFYKKSGDTCKICTIKRVTEMRKVRRKEQGREHKKRNRKENMEEKQISPPATPDSGDDSVPVTLNFGGYEAILAAIETAAENDIRTKEQQIIYILKQYILEQW